MYRRALYLALYMSREPNEVKDKDMGTIGWEIAKKEVARFEFSDTQRIEIWMEPIAGTMFHYRVILVTCDIPRLAIEPSCNSMYLAMRIAEDWIVENTALARPDIRVLRS